MTNPKSPREPLTKEAPNLLGEQIEQLRQIFAHAFSEDKVDFEKLRAALGDVADERAERYSFAWAGKRDAIRLLQTPSRATRIPAPREGVSVADTQNLFIEGDNLEVLKLLYKPYLGRVKMIYIDPPYNTGNDFVYPDNYADPLKTYLERTQQITSNPETSGRYHSAWLSMMYPRLFLARQLLREEGVIFVSIDDHEVHKLQMVMNEAFGEENFIGQITDSISHNPLVTHRTHPHHKFQAAPNSASRFLLYAASGKLVQPEQPDRILTQDTLLFCPRDIQLIDAGNHLLHAADEMRIVTSGDKVVYTGKINRKPESTEIKVDGIVVEIRLQIFTRRLADILLTLRVRFVASVEALRKIRNCSTQVTQNPADFGEPLHHSAKHETGCRERRIGKETDQRHQHIVQHCLNADWIGRVDEEGQVHCICFFVHRPKPLVAECDAIRIAEQRRSLQTQPRNRALQFDHRGLRII